MKLIRRASASVVTTLLGSLLLWAIAAPATAQEVTVLCNFEVDWCEALKAAYEKTTGQKAVFIRRTDGESLAQIRAEKSNPRADVVHAAEVSTNAAEVSQQTGENIRLGKTAYLSTTAGKVGVTSMPMRKCAAGSSASTRSAHSTRQTPLS